MSLAAALARLDAAQAAIAAARAEVAALEAAGPAEASTPQPKPQSPPTAAPGPPHGLSDAKAFFDHVRARPPLGPSLTQAEVDGCARILGACAAAAFPASWTAYALATAYHETAGQLRPIREYGKGAGRPYGAPGRNGGQVAYGRGDVQLTWDANYEAMDAALGLGGRLVADYDLALDPAISARILVYGLEHGTFTGKRLGDYLPARADIHQFANARRVVNGLDEAALIAGYAVTFQDGLVKGGWR